MARAFARSDLNGKHHNRHDYVVKVVIYGSDSFAKMVAETAAREFQSMKIEFVWDEKVAHCVVCQANEQGQPTRLPAKDGIPAILLKRVPESPARKGARNQSFDGVKFQVMRYAARQDLVTAFIPALKACKEDTASTVA